MLSIKKEAFVEIKLDFEEFSEFGEDQYKQERFVLNHFFHDEYLDYHGKCVTELDEEVLRLRSEYQTHIDYVRDLLSSDVEVMEDSNPSDFYNMSLDTVASELNDQEVDRSLLVITLKKGFASLMETSPSRVRKTLLQDILNLLYEKGISNLALVRYFLDSSYKHAETD